MYDDSAVIAAARAQHGLVSIDQARGAGLTNRAVYGRVRRGTWSALHRGVYVVGGAPETQEQRLLGAVLATNGVASHRAAMYLWGFDPPHIEPEVTIDEERSLAVPGVVVHRSRDLRHSHTVLRSGIPTTTATRLLADIGAVLPWWYVERCIDRGIAAGHFTPNDIIGVRWEMSRQGRNGLGALQMALDHAQFGAEEPASVLEAAFARICKEAGLPMPVFQYEVRVAGRTRYIDAAWPDCMLAVEVDGFASRVDRGRFQDDRDRQNALVSLGWTVPRFTWHDVTRRPGYVAATILGLLRRLGDGKSH